MKYASTISVSVLLLTGCATILNPSDDKISVLSGSNEPLVVNVTTPSGNQIGKTPITVHTRAKQGKSAWVTVIDKCYQNLNYPINKSINPTVFLNLLAGVWGAGLDFLTGAMWEYDSTVYINPIKKQKDCNTDGTEDYSDNFTGEYASNNTGDMINSVNVTDLSGPRFGLGYIPSSIIKELEDEDLESANVVTYFGWQFEKQIMTGVGDSMFVFELVPLIGALDQGLSLGSLTAMIGFRAGNGFEVGLGPTASSLGTSVSYALGKSFSAGDLNFPVNLVITPSTSGPYTTVLTGFNW